LSQDGHLYMVMISCYHTRR